jgi:hypothetical protein
MIVSIRRIASGGTTMTRKLAFAALLSATCLAAAHISAQNAPAQKTADKSAPAIDSKKGKAGMTTDQAVFGSMPDGQ